MSEKRSVTVPERNEIEEKYKWRLEDLYPDNDAWNEEARCLESAIENLKEMGTALTSSAQSLLRGLQTRDEIAERLGRLYAYASFKSHEDARNLEAQAMVQRASTVYLHFAEAVSSFVPSILELGKEGIDEFMKEESGLELYRVEIERIMRLKEHILSYEGEKLLAMSVDVGEVPEKVFSLLTNADIKFPKIKDEKGEEVELSEERYSYFLHSKDRRVRRDAFKGLFSSYGNVKNTLSATYLGSLKKDVFYSKARKYENTLQASLYPQNIPIVVYEKAIETINQWLDPLRRYVTFKRKALNLDAMHFYDLYVQLLPEPKAHFSYDDAKSIIIEGLAPLGEEYSRVLLEAFENRWIDVYENKGKRSGAYSWGVYGVHPYVLLNFNGTLRDVFTLGHEMGHAMHSHFTFKSQPYVYSGVSIFTAEVASTTNEILLLEHLIKRAADKAEKAYLVNYGLEQVRTTVYRQLLFAEFELEVHKRIERGHPLTSEDFSAIWKSLYEKHYGDTLFIDEELPLEWARIPHFYTAYYVYQYATGYSAARAIATAILSEGKSAVDRYLRFLSLGDSMDPVDALKVAGVDMTSPRPLELTCKKFEEDLDVLMGLIG